MFLRALELYNRQEKDQYCGHCKLYRKSEFLFVAVSVLKQSNISAWYSWLFLGWHHLYISVYLHPWAMFHVVLQMEIGSAIFRMASLLSASLCILYDFSLYN